MKLPFKPALHHAFSPQCRLQVFGKGPDRPPTNWALAHEPCFANYRWHDQVLMANLQALPEDLRLDIYCPNCRDFNGQTARPEDFPLFNQFANRRFLHGVSTAGMKLPPESALFLATADCPVISVHHELTGECAAVHAGLKELVDYQQIHEGSPSRPNGSVVESLVRAFTGENFKHLRFKIVCGIQHRDFDHPINQPEWGDRNYSLMRHLKYRYPAYKIVYGRTCGRICLRELIIAQLAEFGIERNQIETDKLNTFRHKDLWSNRFETKSGGNPAGRNGIFLIRSKYLTHPML